ncbi:MAG TPA: maleylpyruvate isomerase N-terminal domain-containing protein [Daejeonella sp.]|nr:maleylpyruvate isomerase N-terminal domain-containing protein [Daejeonella sp.]
MIDVLHLFPVLNSSLIEVLNGLDRRQWNNDTLCKQWKVKDIAAHLLDGALRRLSIGRDAYQTEAPEIKSYQDLLNYLNALNADWVNAYKRVSPEIILEQLKMAQVQMLQYLESLDPDAKAIFPVSWAGEDISTNRFDIAREYTERWHHQQQIRQAVGAKS